MSLNYDEAVELLKSAVTKLDLDYITKNLQTDLDGDTAGKITVTFSGCPSSNDLRQMDVMRSGEFWSSDCQS